LFQSLHRRSHGGNHSLSSAVSGLAGLVWIANQYMSIYNRLRLDIKHEKVEIQADEHKISRTDSQRDDPRKAA
jgi:hypothetical protein